MSSHHSNLETGVMVSKWIKFEKAWWGPGGHIIMFNKVNFYAGVSDHWGIGFNINFYDRAITFEILNLYMGVEVWYSEDQATEFVASSKAK